MPNPLAVRAVSQWIANDAFALAVVWHAFVAAGAIAVLRGRVSERTAGQMLTVLLASVSGVSFAFRSPFNGVVCGALAIVLALVARGMSSADVRPGSTWNAAAGIALMALGWAYPEFGGGRLAFLYAAPLGLLPCPTLAMLVGATFFFDGLGSRAWSLIVAAAGLFYGVVGVAWLQVRVDVVLAAGALALAASVLSPLHRGKRPAW